MEDKTSRSPGHALQWPLVMWRAVAMTWHFGLSGTDVLFPTQHYGRVFSRLPYCTRTSSAVAWLCSWRTYAPRLRDVKGSAPSPLADDSSSVRRLEYANASVPDSPGGNLAARTRGDARRRPDHRFAHVALLWVADDPVPASTAQRRHAAAAHSMRGARREMPPVPLTAQQGLNHVTPNRAFREKSSADHCRSLCKVASMAP